MPSTHKPRDFASEPRALKKLKRLSPRWDGAFAGPALSAEEFWKEYDAQQVAGKK